MELCLLFCHLFFTYVNWTESLAKQGSKLLEDGTVFAVYHFSNAKYIKKCSIDRIRIATRLQTIGEKSRMKMYKVDNKQTKIHNVNIK